MANTVSVVVGDSPDYLLNKLLEWDGITIDIFGAPGNQQVEITNDGVLDITSIDHSITITEVNWVYDLSGCCKDVYVKVSANDTTSDYLSEKLTVESTGPLVITIMDPGGDEYYELSFDESKLTLTDELVAVQAWCPSDYLEDVIVVGDWLITESEISTTCQLKISLDDTSEIRKRPCCRRTLSTTFEITGIPNWTNTTVPVVNLWSPYFGLDDITNDVDMLDTTDVIHVTKSGMYKVFIKGTTEINKGIAAFRVFLVATTGTGTYPLDIRYWGPTTTGDYASWNALSLGAHVQRRNTSSFNFINLVDGDYVWVVVKASAEVDWGVEPGNAVDGKIRLLATWDDIEDSGFAFGIEYIGDII